MTRVIGLVGDVHGDVDRLGALLRRVRNSVDELVFLGDYVNRGNHTAEVIDLLVQLDRSSVPCTFLEGNHDAAFRLAISGDDVDAFLQMGGAATIRSYISSIDADWEAAFQSAVPLAHKHFLGNLESEFRLGDELVAAHRHLPATSRTATQYCVFGHSPQRSTVPRIDDHSAFIDTGCGTFDDGKLTCFFWPSKEWIQA